MIRIQSRIGTEPYFGAETMRPCQNVPSRGKPISLRARAGHRPVACVTETADRERMELMLNIPDSVGPPHCRERCQLFLTCPTTSAPSRIVNLWDYIYNLISSPYALRTRAQDANPRAYHSERRSQTPRRGFERPRGRERDESIGSDCWRLLQALPEQGRASCRSHCAGILGINRKG